MTLHVYRDRSVLTMRMMNYCRCYNFNFHKLLTLIVLILSINTSCTSGGGSNQVLPVLPVILAELDSFSPADVPPGFAPSGCNSSATVGIWNDANGAEISNATVDINGVNLAYNASAGIYQGYLSVSPSERVTLSVAINGESYVTSATQFATYPGITSPESGASWYVGDPHTLTWSDVTSYTDLAYVVGVLDAGDPNKLIWPSDNYLLNLSSDVTSTSIPANSMSVGNRLAIAGIMSETINSDYNSYFIDLYVAGLTSVPFNAVPFAAPTNVVATAGDGQISLSWAPVKDALSYNIYWSPTAAQATKASGTKIAGVTSPALHEGLSNRTRYYYVVTAVTGTGESTESTPVVSAVPGTTLMGDAVQGYPLALAYKVSALAGMRDGYGSADGTGTAARFYNPGEITTDGVNLYVADTQNHTIRKVEIASSKVITVAGKAGVSGNAGGTGQAARFYYPSGITTDGTYLYVADTNNHSIRKIVIATGEVTTLAAGFNTPNAITTDGTSLFVIEHNMIRKIVISTGDVSTLAGSAVSNPPWDSFADGTGTAARFYEPKGITTDGTNLYVADTSNCVIRKIVISSGVVTTLAGVAQQAGSSDGTVSARFVSPTAITTDGTYLYVSDVYQGYVPNYVSYPTIREITIADGLTWTHSPVNYYGSQSITTDGISLYIVDSEGLEKMQ